MIFDTAKYTNPGGREINEDSLLCKNGVWIVADGLGGHADGEKASAEAIRYFEENCCGDYTDQRVNELLEGANAAVCRLNGPGRSTAAAAFAENGVFRMANVGDSRVYYFRDGKIIAQTKDHSVCQASVDMGMMTADDIRTSEDRSSLLKVLGNEHSLNIKKPYPPIDIQSGDAFLVCSDGFWEYVLESEMEADLLKSDSADTWMSHMLKRHLIRAQNHGDNYTVICGFIYRDASDTPVAAPVPKVRPSIIIIAAAVVLFAAAMGAIALLSSENNAPDTDITETASMTETAAAEDETSETEISESETEESFEETEETSEMEVAVPETEETGSESTVTEVPETESEAPETVTKVSETTTKVSETTTTTTKVSKTTAKVSETTTKASETTTETAVPAEAEVTEAPETTTKERKSETETETDTVTTPTQWSCDTSPESSKTETETEETTSQTTAPNKQTESESTKSDANESSSASGTRNNEARK